MTDTFIETTLTAALKTLTKYITAANLAEPNKSFNKPTTGGWYEIDFLPGSPTQAELGASGRNRWVGIYQVTVCVPLNTGKDMANARYDAIADLFKRGAVFSGVEITGCSRGNEDSSSDHYRLPVRIAYRADLAN